MSIKEATFERGGPSRPLVIPIPTDEWRSMPIPGLGKSAKIGSCFIGVTDLPEELKRFMKVNPRVPTTNKKGVLSGPVIKGIQETLTDIPEDMVLKNQGIYLLVERASFSKEKGGQGIVTLRLTDPEEHGIVNGGHTFAAILDVRDNATEIEDSALSNAFVRLHIMEGISREKVADIAEGLNRSKQVDDPTIANLRGRFKRIEQIMEGHPGADQICYRQGEEGEIYISEILAYLQLFNCERFTRERHPHRLYSQQSVGLKFFEEDSKPKEDGVAPMDLLIPRLPEILQLADKIRKMTPRTAKESLGFVFGRSKYGRKSRTGSREHKNTPLHFIGETMDHRVHNGWLFPMLAAFRANVRWDLRRQLFEWIVPPDELLPEVMEWLIAACIQEYNNSAQSPQLMGKRAPAYTLCYERMLMYLVSVGKRPPKDLGFSPQVMGE